MIKEAFNYKGWADRRALRAIGEVDEYLHTDSFAFMLQQLNHMVIVEDLFRSRLINEPALHTATNSKTVPNLDTLKSRLIASSKWYLNYVASLSMEIVYFCRWQKWVNDCRGDIVSYRKSWFLSSRINCSRS